MVAIFPRIGWGPGCWSRVEAGRGPYRSVLHGSASGHLQLHRDATGSTRGIDCAAPGVVGWPPSSPGTSVCFVSAAWLLATLSLTELRTHSETDSPWTMDSAAAESGVQPVGKARR